MVTASVGIDQNISIRKTRTEVQEGDMVFLLTDGISDNFTPDEIAQITSGMTPEQAMRTLETVTRFRMENMDQILQNTIDTAKVSPKPLESLKDTARRARRTLGKYADGYLSEPKKDNRGAIAMQI